MAFCWDVSSVCSDHHGEQVYHKLTHRRAQGISEFFFCHRFSQNALCGQPTTDDAMRSPEPLMLLLAPQLVGAGRISSHLAN